MHCKDVSMRDVDFEITEESIASMMDGWRSYVRTEFLILRHDDDYAVIELIKEPGTELFRSLAGFRIVSMPEDTVFHEDPGLDVLNTPALARLQAQYPGKCVVMRGMFSHINFIRGLEPERLLVVDNIPPTPAKLGVLVDIALGSGYIDHPIVKEERIIDMAGKVPEVKTEAVMFPCRVSNLSSDKPFYFLDDAPELEHEVTLIGCHLSERIFRSLYGKDAPFINVCPADFADPGCKCIAKCCKVKNGHVIDGNVALVPWGATVPEVVEAINDLFSAGSS
jgi:hypothetical protein